MTQNRKLKTAGILKRKPHDLRVGNAAAVIGERNSTGCLQISHFSQGRALQTHGKGRDRQHMHAGLTGFFQNIADCRCTIINRPGVRHAGNCSKATGSGGPRSTRYGFLVLVAGLAQQAEVLLTGGHGMTAQPEEAQRVIEYLAMLETKTAGNLSAEEKQVLSGVIFQLRSLFVQHNA